MSNIFQQIIDSIKQVAKDSGQFHPLFAESDSTQVSYEAYYAQIDEDYDEAIRLYSEALKIYPNNGYARDNRARVYISIKDYDSALADVEYTLRRTPYHLEAIELRGEIYLRMDNYKSAIADFTYVIDVPKNIDKWRAYYLRAVSARDIEPTLSIHDFTFLITLNEKPKLLYDLYFRRGDIYEILGDSKKALKDYETAIIEKPDYSNAYGACARIYQQEKQYEKALIAVDKQIELDPKNSNYVASRGRLFFVQKKYAESIADDLYALELDPNNYWVHNSLAFSYSQLDDLEKALSFANKAIEQNSPRSAFFDTRAQIYWLMGDYDKALADFEVGSQLKDIGLCTVGKAVTYDAMGDTAKAIELWNEAIQLDETLADPTVFDEDYHYTPKYVQAIRELADKAKLSPD